MAIGNRVPDYGRQGSDRPRWDRRDLAFVCGAAVFTGTTLAYAGPSWAAVLYQLLSDGVVLALWLAGAAGAGSLLVRPFLRGDDVRDAGVLRFVTSTAFGLGAFSLVTLGLGLAGLLNGFTAWSLPAVGVGLVVARLAVRGRQAVSEADAAFRAWRAAPAGWGWVWLAVVPLLSIAAVGAVLPPGMLWHPAEPHGYDVVEYHLQVPREWYEAGRIVPLRHNVFSYFPFNVEMHYLLAMHLRGGPWKGMYLAQFMHVAYVVLSVLAVYGVAGELRRSTRTECSTFAPTLAAVAAAGVPWLTLLAPMGYNEGGLLLYGTLAVGWALRAAFDPPSDRLPRLKRFALAGAFAGFACGTKLTAVPTLLLLLPPVLMVEGLVHRRYLPVPPAGGLAVFVLAGVITFAPWLARNMVWTRNPVFPQAAGLLGAAHFTPVQVERWERAHSPPEGQDSVAASLKDFGRQVVADWRFGFVLLPLAIPLLWAAYRRPGAWPLFSLLVGQAGFWLFLTHHQGRFFVQAVPLAALLLSLVDWSRVRWAGAAVVVLIALGGWFLVHRPFVKRMHGATPWVVALGLSDLKELTPEAARAVPQDATAVLVGEARAFWYQRPMHRLRYRTVFDVDTTSERDVIRAWTLPQGQGANDWLVVDPEELERFNRTYYDVPALSAEYRDRTDHFLLPPPP